MTSRSIDVAAAWVAHRATAIIVALGVGMLAAYLAALSISPRAGGRAIFGDATHHFVQLRSIVFDGDLHFQNEYTRMYRLRGGVPGTEWVDRDFTQTGHVRNYMPIGPALLWAPLYLLAAGVHFLLALAGATSRPDGYEWVLQLMPGITGIAASTAAAWLSWRLAGRSTHPASAAIATIAVWAGTRALYHSLVSSAYSHAPSMLTSALFFSAWLAWRSDFTIRRAAVLGVLAGLSALMRWQDALFVLVPAIDLARWQRPWSERAVAAAALGAAGCAAFSPQMLVWFVIYGRPFTLPQGPSFMNWTSPHPWAVLFSDSHGLFVWAPLLLFAVLGLFGFMKKHPSTAIPISVVLIGSWYVNAAVSDWWAGEAFGARRFLSLFPLFVLGLATWLDGVRVAQGSALPRRLALLSVLVVANLLLLLQYQLALKGLETISPYPHGPFDMWVTRFLVPIRLLAWWTS
jgi:hypothetical protein